MTPFAILRRRIGWNEKVSAERLRRNERTVRRWDKGDGDAPANVLDYLATVAEAIDAVPPPADPPTVEPAHQPAHRGG